jgi:hypothetical protein
MPKRVFALQGEPLLEIASYGRRGSSSNLRLTPAELQRIARTVARAPEVMVKVSGGAKSLRGASAHLRYIDRQGRPGPVSGCRNPECSSAELRAVLQPPKAKRLKFARPIAIPMT